MLDADNSCVPSGLRSLRNGGLPFAYHAASFPSKEFHGAGEAWGFHTSCDIRTSHPRDCLPKPVLGFETTQQRAARQLREGCDNLYSRGCLELTSSGAPHRPPIEENIDITRSTKFSDAGSTMHYFRPKRSQGSTPGSRPPLRRISSAPGMGGAQSRRPLPQMGVDGGSKYSNPFIARFLDRTSAGGIYVGSSVAAEKVGVQRW
mmetsp:Transcript_11257/g.30135  ORF Transcript_11257/g.30135 Transcript_11257/m.30135 type:complete len:204 (+) Transcript_11257:95-706(+)|eukprot:CAMPEP_0115535868 /NCGR_PEP_ID=MMETSP0271-20121206/87479_1 /TAXON_ID=71861 /ORGANISM="Scrippsiella trochoidea, Strain CCMP3099" /LENGTH=203 /DNA_ID=CAMNT_0002968535 /DNA_START=15 /DNA_END=626 /DNA_ORIENTATION=+